MAKFDEDEEAKSEGDSAGERVATAGAWPPLAFVRASTSLAEAKAEAVSRRADEDMKRCRARDGKRGRVLESETKFLSAFCSRVRV